MNNNNNESGKTAAITSYILGIGVYSNVYEPEDKMRLLVSHSTRA
jgi:hypothetical protein